MTDGVVSSTREGGGNKRLDVEALLDRAPFGGYQWLIFALCFLIVLLDGFDTAAIGYIAPSLMEEWAVPRTALAPVLSAALFGLAAGALSAGPLADRFGRKRVLVGSVFLFGAACLVSSASGDLQTLTWLRFITGVGLGAAMPNAVTLMSEYSPQRKRALITNAMFCGFPLGASCGGFLAAWIIPEFGWRSVLVLGGVLPLVLALVLVLALPESVRYMVSHGWPAARVHRVLARVVRGQDVSADVYVLPEVKADDPAAETDASVRGGGKAGVTDGHAAPGAARPADEMPGVRVQGSHAAASPRGLGLVLSREFRLGSLMLWVAYFMGLVVFYAMINWMPVLFRSIDIDAATAARITALFPLGGMAAILLGWLMDRYNATLVLALGYLGTALSIWAIGQAVGNLGLLMACVFVAGVIMNATQAAMPALGAHFYPTRGRATGVAWMLGVGRFGGIAGSFLVAALAARDFDFAGILTVLAVPGLIAMAALLVKMIAYRKP
ncbi:MAG: aromatic acid/H+ symport family MFS transporter [Lautropia sp.]|nr:aromatic acid/H+ symport family MFS transporter [Lautropia sp.]